MDFLVRAGKRRRDRIEIVWKADEDKPVKEEVTTEMIDKEWQEWERDHDLWAAWDEKAAWGEEEAAA
jgi:hypothetical protein